MQTSANGLAFIAANEGYSPTPTSDNGHPMWGHGHDQRGSEPIPASISLEDADALLVTDCRTFYEPTVRALAPWANQTQFDALVDFAYNLGTGALATMLHHGRDQVVAQMPAWCYEHINGVATRSEGLAVRRAKEIALYVS